jgi:hypothetical protein
MTSIAHCHFCYEVVHDPDITANTVVRAEFAGLLTVGRFIGNLGLNQSARCRMDAFEKSRFWESRTPSRKIGKRG